jgi:hypothetical protein
MPNIIEFLERMGQDAQLRHATDTNIEKQLVSEHFEPLMRSAILAKDTRQIEALLNINPKMCCLVYALDEDVEIQTKAGNAAIARHSTQSIVATL